MGCSFSRTQAEPAAHPLISAVELATSRGVSQAELRAYCAAIPTPPSTAAPLDWGAWVDGLVQWNAQRTALPPWPGKREGGGCEIGETALRGITLRQLRFIYAQASARCEADGWKSFDVASKSWSGPPISPAKLNLYELVQYWIKPQTAERGCSMVEQLADGAQPPRFFASHWWGEPVCEFIACVEQHVADHKHVGVDEDTPYWVRGCLAVLRAYVRQCDHPPPAPLAVRTPRLRPAGSQVCAYANNQHDIGSELSGDVGMSPFVRALHLADGIITIADENAIVLTRAWCGYEMFQATVRRGGSFAHDIYTALHGSGQSDARPAVGMLSGFAATDMKMAILKANREAGFPPLLVQRACGFELREAQASQATDLAAIMASVGTDLPRVNATVRIRFGSRLLPQLLTGGDPSQLATLCAELKSSELRALSLFADARVGLVSAAAVRQVAIALPPALVELTGWEIGSGALGALADRIRHGRLLRLKLQKCSLGDADAAELGAALGESGARLQELDLW